MQLRFQMADEVGGRREVGAARRAMVHGGYVGARLASARLPVLVDDRLVLVRVVVHAIEKTVSESCETKWCFLGFG